MKQNVKVLHVTSVDLTVEKFLIPFLTKLKDEGFEVHIACSKGRYTPGIKERGFNVHDLHIDRRINPLSNLVSLWHLYRLIKSEKFQIVHVHTPVASVLGRIAAWTARVPVIIYTVHGFYFHEFTPTLKKIVLKWLEKILCKTADHIFTVSEEDAFTAISANICPANKVVWISNGVDINRFQYTGDTTALRHKYDLLPGDKVIGFVGRFVKEKGILDLLTAMDKIIEKVPSAKLLVVGGKEDSDRDEKTKEIINGIVYYKKLASNIKLTGFLDDMPEVLSVMDIFTLPSYREGMPISVIEAMASGKPVVATNIRGCREEVVEGLTGLLVPVGEPSILADAIISILSNEKLAKEMGLEGRKRACELFDENITIDKQLQVYQSIIRKRIN